MKKQILSISPAQTAKVLAVMYFVVSFPMVLLMAIPMLLTPGPKAPLGFLVAMPFLYAIFGFIFTAIGAWFYNIVAGKIGGIEYTTSDVESA